MRTVLGITGQRFGRLVAGGLINAKSVLCRCDCGAECNALVAELRAKRRRSCRACVSPARRGGRAVSFPPPWYAPNKAARRQDMAVARGLHPMGLHLLGGDKTCGDCANLVRRSMGSTYLKCGASRQTRSRATDIRARWPACEAFRVAGVDQKPSRAIQPSPNKRR